MSVLRPLRVHPFRFLLVCACGGLYIGLAIGFAGAFAGGGYSGPGVVLVGMLAAFTAVTCGAFVLAVVALVVGVCLLQIVDAVSVVWGWMRDGR